MPKCHSLVHGIMICLFNLSLWHIYLPLRICKRIPLPYADKFGNCRRFKIFVEQLSKNSASFFFSVIMRDFSLSKCFERFVKAHL